MATLFSPAPTCAVPPVAEKAGPVQVGALAGLAVFGAALLAYVGFAHGAKQAVLLALGIGLGVALFHSRFGFTSAWRQLVAVGNGTGVRAHAVLLGTTATLFALVIGTGTGLFGSTPAPTAGPLGVGLVLGAFVFGDRDAAGRRLRVGHPVRRRCAGRAPSCSRCSGSSPAR